MNNLRCFIILCVCMFGMILPATSQSPTAQNPVLIPFQNTITDLWGFKDSITGQEIVKAQFGEVGAFRYGFALVNVGGTIEYDEIWEEDVVEGGKYGYINSTGQLVIPAIYDDATSFKKNGTAIVGTYITFPDNEEVLQYGLINTKGVLVIPLQYDDVNSLMDNYYSVRKGQLYGVISHVGKTTVPLIYNRISEEYGLLLVEKGDSCGLIDVNNRQLIPVVNKTIETDGSNFFEIVTNTKKTYYYHTNGSIYDTKELTYNNRSIIVSKDGKYGLINYEQIVLAPFVYDKITSYLNGNYLLAVKNGKMGYVTTQGEEVVPCIYDNLYLFDKGSGLALAIKDKKQGYIDSLGVERIPVKYDKLFVFNEKEFIQKTQLNDKNGLIDLKAKKELVPPIYEYIREFEKDYYLVIVGGKVNSKNQILGGKSGLLSKKGIELMVPSYDYIGPFIEDRSLVLSGAVYDTIAAKFVGGKYGYIDRSGAVVIPLLYTDAGQFKDGKATVTLDGKEIIILPNGKKYIKPYSNLNSAIYVLDFDAIADLIDKGANVNERSEYVNEKSERMAAEYPAQLLYLRCLRSLDNSYGDKHYDKKSFQLLNTLKIMVEHGLNVNTFFSSNGTTALTEILRYGLSFSKEEQLAIITYLLEKGADVNSLNGDRMSKTDFPDSPLSVLLTYRLDNSVEVCTLLFKYSAAKSCVGNYGKKLLKAAKDNNQPKEVQAMIQQALKANK